MEPSSVVMEERWVSRGGDLVAGKKSRNAWGSGGSGSERWWWSGRLTFGLEVETERCRVDRAQILHPLQEA